MHVHVTKTPLPNCTATSATNLLQGAFAVKASSDDDGDAFANAHARDCASMWQGDADFHRRRALEGHLNFGEKCPKFKICPHRCGLWNQKLTWNRERNPCFGLPVMVFRKSAEI